MSNLTLSAAHNKFMRVKMIEGLAPRTISDYINNFGYLMNYLGTDILLYEFTVEKIREYIYYMKYERELSNYTINIRIRNLRAFLRFSYQEGYIPDAIHHRIKLMKTDIDHIQALTPEEFKKLVKIVENNRINFTRIRNKLILYLLLDTMVRVSELVQIKVKNIDLKNNIIILTPKTTKTRKHRIVPFSEMTKEIIINFLSKRKFKESEFLFTNFVGEPMTRDNVNQNFRQWGIAAGIKGKRVSPHTMRHTGALFYILNGGDSFSLQKILGHTTMEMVRRYVQMTDDLVKINHVKFSPVNRLDDN